MALFLRDDEVNQCVDMAGMLSAVEGMQKHFGMGEAYNLPRRKIISEGGQLAVMGGGLFYDGVLGVKTYTVVRGQYSFQVSLYDADTGALLCYTQANRLGQLRTGATTGVAVKHLANAGAVTLGIIGTGYQAPTQLEAVSQVREVKQVRAYSRDAQRRGVFAESMTGALGVEVAAANSGEEAARGADVVICIAATMEAVLQGEWLSAGSFGNRRGTHHVAGAGGGRCHVDPGRPHRGGLVGPGSGRGRGPGQRGGPGPAPVEPVGGITGSRGGNDSGTNQRRRDYLCQADGHRRRRRGGGEAGLRQCQSRRTGPGNGVVAGEKRFGCRRAA